MNQQAPLAATYTGADPAMDPETRGPGGHYPEQSPNRARGPRPRQAGTGSEPAHTKAPSPGHREPPIHQWAQPETGPGPDTNQPPDPGDGPLHWRQQSRLVPALPGPERPWPRP
ncbi:hypothetical protein AMECASPLE_008299 [Ameca splendens]|uniref:Uncharacterized protein n=1 Tax=Ameca splendens TaxID=208324 RepID=A0ABV0YBB6_9TELE